MNTRNSYHTSLKLAVALDVTNGISKELLCNIPSSTKSDWKRIDAKQIIGKEYANLIAQNFDQANTFLDPQLKVEKAIFMTIARVKFFLLDLISAQQLQSILQENMTKTVNFVERFQNNISIKNACRLLNIPVNTFYHWRTKVKFQCSASALLFCVQRHPNQATIQEINTIKKYLNNPKFAYWGIANIWGFAFKNNATSLSLQSWYRYNKLLKIRLKKPKFKLHDYKPLKANRVNEYWHIDISKIRTSDGVLHFLYALKDNFSKKIITWYLHHRVDGKVTTLLIKKACVRVFGEIPCETVTKLVSDGGPENTSYAVKDFINDAQINIEHLIALKDIKQSNSMIESFFKGIKSGYLYHKEVKSRKQLFKEITLYYKEYNEVKPHYAHKIYTPDEVYSGLSKPINYAQRSAHAAIKRREQNKNNGCGRCKG